MNNFEIACSEVDELEGEVFRYHKDGSLWVLQGILICRDDMYYEMTGINNPGKRKLLSFVGNPESFGFEHIEGDS